MDKRRISAIVDFTPDSWHALCDLQVRIQAKSPVATIGRALHLLRWMVKQLHAGNQFRLIYANGEHADVDFNFAGEEITLKEGGP